MFQFSTEQVKLLDDLNASVRFSARAPTYRDNPIAGGLPVVDTDPKFAPCCICEITDKTVGGDPYVQGRGATDQDAFITALLILPTAEKPMTPAQKYQFQKQAAAAAEKDNEIAQLKAQLAEAQLKVSQTIEKKSDSSTIKKGAVITGDMPDRIR